MPLKIPHIREQTQWMTLAFSVVIVGRRADRSMHSAIIPETPLATDVCVGSRTSFRNNPESRITDLCGGCAAMCIPTATEGRSGAIPPPTRPRHPPPSRRHREPMADGLATGSNPGRKAGRNAGNGLAAPENPIKGRPELTPPNSTRDQTPDCRNIARGSRSSFYRPSDCQEQNALQNPPIGQNSDDEYPVDLTDGFNRRLMAWARSRCS